MDLLTTVTCIVALSLGLFAELGGCTPDLTHNRQSILPTSPDRNTVDLFCREGGSETLATFWNGNTQLNSIPSATHTHNLTPETEAGVVCRNEEGVMSNEIRLAALPFDMQVQDDPPRVQCVRRGEQVELPCEYPPGNLSELYSVQWRFRVNGSTVLVPPGFGPNDLSGNLQSIDEDTFALTVAVDRLEQTGDQFHCDVDVRRNNIGLQQQTTVRYIGAIVQLKVEELVEIVEEVQDSRVNMGEPASFTCVATGTDVTISWEIDGQSYTDCSNVGFCVTTTASGSMMVSSTITVNASLANNTRVLCRASQMCGTVSSTVSSGTLSFQATTPTPTTDTNEPSTATAATATNNPDLSEEDQTQIFVLSVIVAFIVLIVLVLISCVCSLRILYNCGKISTKSRVIRNRPLLQRTISGDRIPRVTAANGHDHDYENMDAELGSINAHDGGSGYVYPRSDVSDQERVSQIYNWSRESGGSSNVVPNHLARGTPSISIAGSQPSLQQPFNRTSYAESESKTPGIEKRLSPTPIDENSVPSLKTQADCDSPNSLGEDPNWRLPPLRELFLSPERLPVLSLYGTQSKASHILSGSVYVFDSHFNQPSDEDMTTSAHKQTSIPLIKSIDTVEYGSGGGMYINRMHDITIKILERAIPEGTVLQFSISAMLYGPFLFPAGVRPVSPILWLCTHPTLTFSRPIEVVLPHYLHCEDQNDTENLMFLKVDHNSLIDGKIRFKPADGKSVFKHHTNYGVLYTNHCCFLCIAAKMTEKDTPKTNLSLITAYPRNPQEHPWNVYFGVTYLLTTCMQAFRNQFTDDYHILRARKFRMQDAAERKIEICYPKKLPQQWLAGLNGSNKILASDVDFWSIWNRNPTELITMEQEKMYPPNFDVIIDGHSAVGSTMLTASFSGTDCPLVVEIPLLLPASTQHEIPNKPLVSNEMNEQDDTIELRELCLELHTVDDWFNLGIYLGISYSKLKIIEVQYHDPHRCRTEMLQSWVDNFQPSWSAVIEALKLIEMSQLAKSLAAKKVSPLHVPLHVQTTSPTPPQGYFPHQTAQPRQTHPCQFSSTGHMRGARGRSSLHVSKAAVTETLC